MLETLGVASVHNHCPRGSASVVRGRLVVLAEVRGGAVALLGLAHGSPRSVLQNPKELGFLSLQQLLLLVMQLFLVLL
jgi:hypothetical protein